MSRPWLKVTSASGLCAVLVALGAFVTACAASEPAPPVASEPVAMPSAKEGLPAYLFEGPVRKPGPISYEAEALMTLGVVANSLEAPMAQHMKSFGEGWSGGAQLFWPARAVGSRLTLKVPLLVPARYEVDAYLTRAPDFGILQFEVGGEELPVVFDGYAPQVEPSGRIHLGTVALQTNTGSLTVRVVGRNEASSGHFAGIDRIVLLIVRTAP